MERCSSVGTAPPTRVRTTGAPMRGWETRFRTGPQSPRPPRRPLGGAAGVVGGRRRAPAHPSGTPGRGTLRCGMATLLASSIPPAPGLLAPDQAPAPYCRAPSDGTAPSGAAAPSPALTPAAAAWLSLSESCCARSCQNLSQRTVRRLSHYGISKFSETAQKTAALRHRGHR